MAEIDRVEVLLQLAENQRRDNQNWREQVWSEAKQRASALEVTIARLEKEFGLLHADLAVTKKYFPQQQGQLTDATQALAAGAKVTSTGQGGGGGRS